MTYGPTGWVDYGVPCIDAANLNNMEAGIDRAQGDVMVLYDLTANLPASDPLLVGRLYFATDAPYNIYRDNGAGWDIITNPAMPSIRRIYGNPESGQATTHTMTVVGRVYLYPVEIPWDFTIDRIYYSLSSVVAGNVRVAIYEEGAADTPAGGNLMVESASVAVPGTNRWVEVTVANTALTAGLHFLAIQSDSTTCRLTAVYDGQALFNHYYTLGGYGVFTDPCPAVLQTTRKSDMGIRIASIP